MFIHNEEIAVEIYAFTSTFSEVLCTWGLNWNGITQSINNILSSSFSLRDLYIYFLWQDEKRLRKALYFANVCGAITVTERGAIPALPTKEDVLQFFLEAAAI